MLLQAHPEAGDEFTVQIDDDDQTTSWFVIEVCRKTALGRSPIIDASNHKRGRTMNESGNRRLPAFGIDSIVRAGYAKDHGVLKLAPDLPVAENALSLAACTARVTGRFRVARRRISLVRLIAHSALGFGGSRLS